MSTLATILIVGGVLFIVWGIWFRWEMKRAPERDDD